MFTAEGYTYGISKIDELAYLRVLGFDYVYEKGLLDVLVQVSIISFIYCIVNYTYKFLSFVMIILITNYYM